jgi:hypothetical protein
MLAPILSTLAAVIEDHRGVTAAAGGHVQVAAQRQGTGWERHRLGPL